jgi:hypothetical protein
VETIIIIIDIFGVAYIEIRLLQVPAKTAIIMLAVYGPHSWFDIKQRSSFLIKFGVFYNKSKIPTILFIVKYEKITLFDQF